MPILITGGAGYIGSHTVKYFQKQNEDIIVVDNMQVAMMLLLMWNICTRLTSEIKVN